MNVRINKFSNELKHCPFIEHCELLIENYASIGRCLLEVLKVSLVLLLHQVLVHLALGLLPANLDPMERRYQLVEHWLRLRLARWHLLLGLILLPDRFQNC
jgi:hypothetical protein